MSELGDLLERLHSADDSFSTLVAELHFWNDWVRGGEASQAHLEEHERRTLAKQVKAQRAKCSYPRESDQTVRLWIERPDRIRLEHNATEPLRSGYAVRVGKRWWTYSEAGGATTNAGDPRTQSGLGEDVDALLRPSRLLGALRFEPRGMGELAGRRAHLASAVPGTADYGHEPAFWPLHHIGHNADEYEMWIDDERGILLRVEARWRGDIFAVREVVRARFDEPIPAERFEFEPPEGEEIRDASEMRDRFMSHVSLHEAVRQMPFTVFIPDVVPPEWELRVTAHKGLDRPPAPPALTLLYRARDATSGMALTEISEDAPSPLPYVDGADEWREVRRGDRILQVHDASSNRPQSQVVCVIEGTRITLASNSLGADALVALVDRLRPVSSEPPTI